MRLEARIKTKGRWTVASSFCQLRSAGPWPQLSLTFVTMMLTTSITP